MNKSYDEKNTNRIYSFHEKQQRKKKIILLFALAGIILTAASYIQSVSTKAVTDEITSNSSTHSLEKRLESIIEAATGDGNVEVMITLEDVVETVYEAADGNSDTSLFGSPLNDTQNELSAKYNMQSQKIKGVMIVCKSISHKDDFKTIKRAVSTALGINENQIYIIGGTV